MRKGQLKSSADAVPAKRQHKGPCSDCPWSRQALPGWLGGQSADEWIGHAHGESRVECHTLAGAQCAGMAIYRANACKSPRDPEALRLPADRTLVFVTPAEFQAHHTGLQSISKRGRGDA